MNALLDDMLRTVNEARNEKGLTCKEYLRRERKILRMTLCGVLLSGALSIANATYQINQKNPSIPEQPESYQTYVDATRSLETLEDLRHQFLVNDLPYKTPELEDIMAGIYNEGELNRAISIVQDKVHEIESKNPEVVSYEAEVAEHNRKYNNRIFFSGLGILLIGGIGSMILGGRKRKQLGSYNFRIMEK